MVGTTDTDAEAVSEPPTVSVTGAAGYVGSRVVNRIRNEHPDWEVRPFDNFSRGELRTLGDVDVTYLDVRHRSRVEDALSGSDIVLHLAALSDVDQCSENQELAFETNVQGTNNIAWFCKKKGVGLTFPFSMAVLGDPEEQPITVNAERRPMNWYGETKLIGERTIESLADGAFPSHLFLKANVYGEHQIDDQVVSRGMVVDFFVRRAFSNAPMTVYKPGTQARNYVHVNDVATAYLNSTERLLSQLAVGRTGVEKYEIASDEDWTVMELAELVQQTANEEAGISPDIELVENPRGNETLVTDFTVDISAAERDLEWVPAHSVQDTVRRLVSRRAE